MTAGSLEAPGVSRLLVLPAGVKQQLTKLGVTHQNGYLTHRGLLWADPCPLIKLTFEVLPHWTLEYSHIQRRDHSKVTELEFEP